MMTQQISDLAQLGWNNFFLAQLDPGEVTELVPVRVMSVHRSAMQVAGISPDHTIFEQTIAPYTAPGGTEEMTATVGDWLLLDATGRRVERLLERKSVFKRRAPDHSRRLQLIAANVDTLFIVSSCNQDFNVARLERYLALAGEAGVTPVIVLTKADLVKDPHTFRQRAGQLMPGLVVEILDARTPDQVSMLLAWCTRGQTIAFVGSSGVGKSTLINTLTGDGTIATGAIREDDARGRHTTSGRQFHHMPSGAWLLDTPGMRELQMTDVQDGIAAVFADVVELAAECRFSDCGHDTEPGCAVKSAIAAGTLDPKRLDRWRKLAREDQHNTQSIAERRNKERAFGKHIKRTVAHKRKSREE